MSGNLLNNDNKTNYLFKKENYVIQSTLAGFGDTSVPERHLLVKFTVPNQLYLMKIFLARIYQKIYHKKYIVLIYLMVQ